MEEIFLKILNMSITAGYLVLAVLLLRLVLKKAPKWLHCALWTLVGLRLVLPFSFKSVLSLIPSAHTVPADILYAQVPAIQSGIPAVNNSLNPIIFESMAPTLGNSVNPMQIAAYIASFVWIVGMGIMLLYAAISYRRVRSRVQNTKFLRENIVICPQVDTPFILGIFRPTIYLPEGLSEADTEYVIAHEKAHLRRKDHWWKPLGFFLLSIYWFHPLLWVAYIFLCRDIEFACDEKVIRELGAENKKPYAEALINCSAPRHLISACPVAFGESGIKGRIKSVLHYKKPTLWILIAGMILSVAAAVCFLTDPPEQRIYSHKQSMYLTVATSTPGFQAIQADLFYAFDAAGILYEVTKTPPAEREAYDDSNEIMEGDQVVVFFDNQTRVTDQYSYPEGNRPSYILQATCIQLHFSLLAGGETTAGVRWFRATVLSKTEEFLVVTPHPKTMEAAQASTMKIDSSGISTTEDLQSGDSVIIYYYLYALNGDTILSTCRIVLSTRSGTQMNIDTTLFDTTLYDIDNDGEEETVSIGYGPTSGLFTFVVTVADSNGMEYGNVFLYAYGELSFTEENGKLQIRYQDIQGDNHVCFLNIAIYGNNILLYDSGKQVATWGN